MGFLSQFCLLLGQFQPNLAQFYSNEGPVLFQWETYITSYPEPPLSQFQQNLMQSTLGQIKDCTLFPGEIIAKQQKKIDKIIIFFQNYRAMQFQLLYPVNFWVKGMLICTFFQKGENNFFFQYFNECACVLNDQTYSHIVNCQKRFSGEQFGTLTFYNCHFIYLR